MTHLSLVVPPPAARKKDPKTSKDAAASMRRAASAQCAAVLNALRDLGEAGAEQVGRRIELDAYAVRKRLPELEKAGLAAPTNGSRVTASGRSERIWRVI